MSKVVAKTTHDVANDVNDNDGSVEKIEEKVFLRGNEKVLEFRNVSYEQEGHWVCVASNIIKGNQIILCFKFHTHLGINQPHYFVRVASVNDVRPK